MFKRILSILLTIIFVGSMSLCAFAAEEEPQAKFYRFNNEDLKCTVLIVAYDPQTFPVRGEKPAVLLVTDGKSVTISPDKIVFSENAPLSLLYICLPGFLADDEHKGYAEETVVQIASGAYLTAEGEPCDAISRDARYLNWRGSWTLLSVEGVMPYVFYTAKAPELLEGTEMKVVQFRSAWRSDVVYSNDGEVSEEKSYTYTPSLGRHVLLAKANEFVYEKFEFVVVSQETMRRDNLKLLLQEGFRFGRNIPLGIVGFFIPTAAWGLPAGWVVFLLQAEYFITFARQLFSREVLDLFGEAPSEYDLMPYIPLTETWNKI